jgi:hypothetical protein
MDKARRSYAVFRKSMAAWHISYAAQTPTALQPVLTAHLRIQSRVISRFACFYSHSYITYININFRFNAIKESYQALDAKTSPKRQKSLAVFDSGNAVRPARNRRADGDG